MTVDTPKVVLRVSWSLLPIWVSVKGPTKYKQVKHMGKSGVSFDDNLGRWEASTV